MTRTSAALAAFLLTMAQLPAAPAAAQALDELPGPVQAVAADFVARCIRLGGAPDYEPLDLVRLVFFGKDWDGGGRESYLIDLSKLRCPGGDAGPGGDRPDCEGRSCRLVVVNPRGASGFRVDFNAMVRGWRLAGANASRGGPDVELVVRTGAGETRYRVTGDGMARR